MLESFILIRLRLTFWSTWSEVLAPLVSARTRLKVKAINSAAGNPLSETSPITIHYLCLSRGLKSKNAHDCLHRSG